MLGYAPGELTGCGRETIVPAACQLHHDVFDITLLAM